MLLLQSVFIIVSLLNTLIFSKSATNAQNIDKLNNNITVRVSGGYEAIPHEAPWMASIQMFNNSTQKYYHICGGSMIKPHVILTAGHCLVEFTLEMGYLYVGRHNLSQIESSTQQNRSFDKSNIIVHIEYTYGVGPNDIALIKLTIPLVMTNYVKEIALPSYSIPSGSVRLYGWGQTQYGNSDGVLIIAYTSVIDINLCNSTFASHVLNSNICTASMETAACAGDSGGAVIQRNGNGVDEAVGIVSWGYSQCGMPPSVHTRVSAYIDWILVNSANSSNSAGCFNVNVVNVIVLLMVINFKICR